MHADRSLVNLGDIVAAVAAGTIAVYLVVIGVAGTAGCDGIAGCQSDGLRVAIGAIELAMTLVLETNQPVTGGGGLDGDGDMNR
jgi:hypothetical protein